MRHFLDIRDASTATLQAILDDAAAMKSALKAGQDTAKPLAGKSVAMIFEKGSTRTRCAFEVALNDQGGFSTYLGQGSHVGSKETIKVSIIFIKCALVSDIIQLF